jgi:cyclopropane-fatty-acyl-phospholipid synthase
VKFAIELAERGLVPAPLLRRGIRRLLRQRLAEWRPGDKERWVEAMRAGPLADVPHKANEQHYELPPAFFEQVLGRRLKYSSAWWAPGVTDLDQAEADMLALTCERAGLRDGQDVLELGCGWGSLSLWMAERYPASRILSVSNSAPQREWILARARARGLANLEVLTRDMNGFDTDRRFDRVVSVEMFEHMRNWEALLRRAHGWLRPEGALFLHVFAHRERAYPFQTDHETDWMGRHFFSGGMMPSHDLPRLLAVPFAVERSWVVEGTHYARTAEAWLERLEARRAQVLPVLAAAYGARDARRWFHRWRLFFLACAELFAWDGGREWIVSHHLLRPLRVAAGVSA